MIKIDELDLSHRTKRILGENGIDYLEELSLKTKNEVSQYQGMGRKSMAEILDIMSDNGIDFEKTKKTDERISFELANSKYPRYMEAYRLRSDGMTFKKIGDHFGVSQSRAYQMVMAYIRITKKIKQMETQS